MANASAILAELEALGTEQTRKIYARHGCKSPMFGVSYANFKVLAKRIKIDHALAVALWDSGNHDARVLAMMVADPKQATADQLDRWLADLESYGLIDGLIAYIGRTPFVREKAEAWSPSPDEWVSTSGWGLVATLALTDKALPDDYFTPYLDRIESGIHQQPNRTRYAMNNALISIGCRSAALHGRVQQVTAAIGEVMVDHGETGCETPAVLPYIERVLARKGYVVA